MKVCAYCGQENEDEATCCAGCGTRGLKSSDPTESSPKDVPERGEFSLHDILADRVLLFRTLVVLGVVSYLVWFFHLLLGGRLISQGVWDALSWYGYGAILPLPNKTAWLFMFLWVAVAIGLYGFSKSARLVFTLLVLFTAIITLFQGVQVTTAFGSFLAYITNAADGAVLVMAYTSPLKEKFT